MAEPRRAFADEYAESGVVRLYSDRLRVDLGQLLPMFMPSTRYKDKGWDDKQQSGASTHLFPQFKALASPAGTLVLDAAAASGWATRADAREGILLAGPKVSLPAGAYELTYRVKLGQAIADERAVGRIAVRAGQETLAGGDLGARDLKTGEYQDIKLWFALTERQAVYAELTTPAGSELWADEVVLKPLGTRPARLKGVLWLVALLAFSAYGYWRCGARATEASTEKGIILPHKGYWVMTLLAALVTLALFCRFWYSYVWVREYEAESWAKQTGRAVDDAAASGGRAMAGRVGADQPGWLSYGPYQVFASGSYELDFWIKRGEVAGKGRDSSSMIAFAEVTDVGGGPIYGRREVRFEDIPQAGEYVKLTLKFTNPKWQKLVFRIYFSGVTDLQFDRARFTRLLR